MDRSPAKTTHQEVTDSLEEVEKLFSDYRRSRSRGRIPTHLWRAAVDLSERHSLGRICHVLGLRYDSLKQRVERHHSKSSSTPDRPEFFELSLPPPFSGRSRESACMAEFKILGSSFHLCGEIRINLFSLFRLRIGGCP